MADIKILHDEAVKCPQCGQAYEPHPQLTSVELESLRNEPIIKSGLICQACQHSYTVIISLPTLKQRKTITLKEAVESVRKNANDAKEKRKARYLAEAAAEKRKERELFLDTYSAELSEILKLCDEIEAADKAATLDSWPFLGLRALLILIWARIKNIKFYRTAAPELARLVREMLSEE